MSNANQQVFLQAVIFDPATKSLSEYSPLVIDAGTTPAIAPVPVSLPTGAVVGLFGGANDDTTSVANNQGCDTFTGQVFFCNTRQLFAAIHAAGVPIPPLGTDINGKPCPSVRSFDIVDQDQSDNVQTAYLLSPDGTTAQDTAANRLLLGNSAVVVNPSDNRVLSNAIDPALGCSSWKIPDIADANNPVPTQATNELQAAAYQLDPIAFIPAGDPMVGPNNLALINAYRLDVDQPGIQSLGQANTVPYCQHVRVVGGQFLALNQTLFSSKPSPLAGFANLYDFLHQRWIATRMLLNCKK